MKLIEKKELIRMINKIKTLKELKKSEYIPLDIKKEMIKNLSYNLKNGISTLPRSFHKKRRTSKLCTKTIT